MGVRSPLPGTGDSSATSATGTSRPVSCLTSAAFTPGAAVLRSAQMVPGRSEPSALTSAVCASWPLLTLSTRPASRTASASEIRAATPVTRMPLGS